MGFFDSLAMYHRFLIHILTAVFIKEQEVSVAQAIFTLAAYSYRENRSIPVPQAVRKACLEIE